MGFEQICVQKCFGQFWAKSAQNLFWAGRFKPAQNYGLNHPCPKLANPDHQFGARTYQTGK